MGEREGVVGSAEPASIRGFDPSAPNDADRQKDDPGWLNMQVFKRS